MTVARQAAGVHADLRRLGLDILDMRAEVQLEQTLVGPVELEEPFRPDDERATIQRIEEDPVVSRPIPRTRAPSALRYFLDGAQRTLPAYLVDTVPIVASVNSAAVLERDAGGRPRVMAGSLAMGHAWIAPKRSGRRTMDALIRSIEAHGGRVVDPLSHLLGGDVGAEYLAALEDYATMMTAAYSRAKKLREELEAEVLERWAGEVPDRGWIVVDGALRTDRERAVGLVKSFTRQYLSGSEASMLFRLPVTCRTSAFQVRDKWREGWRTCWYQRFWDASGRDPRHALVRVETSASVRESEEIDEIAAWLMAERLPRATADQRWATLLYPVHFLEQILKRQIDRETSGWPTAR